MIFKEHQIKSVFQQKDVCRIFLFYGPNEGLIRENIKKLTKTFKNGEEAEEIQLFEKSLNDEPNKILEEINTISMFHNKKIVFVEYLKDKQSHIIEELKDLKQENVLIILKSDNLSKSSKLRKLFESSKSMVCIPCYEDDKRAIMNLIKDFQTKFNLELNKEVKNYLMEFLSNDRLVSKSELEKISLLQSSKENLLSLEEIKIVLNDVSSTNLNKINESVMYGKTTSASKTIYKVFSEGINAVAIIRSLINYTLRIQQTQIELKKQKNFDEAIKILKPPVFWKDKDSFRNHCSCWPMSHIEKNIKILLAAEYQCKSKSSINVPICENAILGIAHEGKKYF